MSKVHLFIMVLCASLWAEGSYAQETYVLTLEQILLWPMKPMKVIEPTYRTIYNILRGNIKLRLRLRRRDSLLQH
jgi:hypothetical protein